MSNGTDVRARFLGGALGGVTTRVAGWSANRQAFGRGKSVPGGYNDPARALVPAMANLGYIRARMRTTTAMAASLTGFGLMSAEMQITTGMTAAGVMLSNISATMALETDMTANLTAFGIMSARMDLAARPSAFDISSEVMQAEVEPGLTLKQALRLLSAVLAGPASVAGDVVTFRNTADSVDRVTATLDGTGNRTDVVLDLSDG
jgi:hypothetical protein